jgi:serine/threonine-protein kinase
MTLAAGSRLGPYEIVGLLGAGGMGEVYRARDERLGREVAIKILPSGLSKDADRLRRFEQEARAAGVLNHPNILAIYDLGTHDGSPYVVSELLEGETLRARLAGGAFTPRKALGHALQIANGLAAAHEKGIVHRDLKPENIFVTRDGRVKILDFGLAKLTQPESDQGSGTNLPTASRGTEPGVVLGTLGYMSPEQVRGKPADSRSDIFSFGAILYEMLSGKRAFHGDSAADTMSAILKEDPPELSQTRPGLAPGLDRVVRHCLEKNPEERFQSARDLAFDLETISDVSSPATLPGTRPARLGRLGRPLLVAAGIALALAVVAVLRLRPRGGEIDSIAVLPFVNATPDPSAEYLSDGISESLINTLSQVPQLRVAARTLAFRYKGRDTDPQKVGRELNVRAVLSGKVLQRGDLLDVQADLVDVATGAQLWGDHYNRKLADVQVVEEAIAKEISEKLRLRLTGEEKKKLAKRDTESTEAYQLYLRGRHAWEKRTPAALQESIDYFNRAIDKDPSYALAYAGLADVYAVLSSYSLMSPRDSFPKSRAAAVKALEIDNGLARAHATLGNLLFCYDWNWTGGEAELKKAIRLDPSYPTSYHWYGILLAARGRFDEALEQLHRARDLDPFSSVIEGNIARTHFFAGHYDLAISEGRKTSFGPGHVSAAQAYLAKKMPEEARLEFQKAVETMSASPVSLMFRGQAEAAAGRRADALKTIEEMKTLAASRYISPAYIAQIYIDLGEKDHALDWLEKAYGDHSWDLIFLGVNPHYASLRTDPRFTDLLRRLNLTS